MLIDLKPGCYKRILPLLFLIFISQSAWGSEKTDIIYLKNGDRLTGEIKTMGRGKLSLLTDFMGTVSIEWEQIQQISSKTDHSIELTNGQRFYGAIEKSDDENGLVIKTPLGPANMSINDVFAMYPVEANFWERLDINVDLGVSWDKGSQIGKFNFGLDTAYRRPQSITRASLSTEVTTQDKAEDTQRSSLSVLHNVFRPNKRFVSYFSTLDSNDQLGVDLRALAGAGYGWVPVRSQSNWLSFALGLDVNREKPTSGEPETNLEGVGWLTYEYYKFTTPERSFKTNLKVFPSITDFGRWRASFTSDFRWEIFTDLFWVLSLYGEYDNQPISAQAESIDYGVITSIGYKF
jgi:hypothetical protein